MYFELGKKCIANLESFAIKCTLTIQNVPRICKMSGWIGKKCQDKLESFRIFKNVWMNWKVSDDVKNVLKFNNLSGYFKRSLDENVFG